MCYATVIENIDLFFSNMKLQYYSALPLVLCLYTIKTDKILQTDKFICCFILKLLKITHYFVHVINFRLSKNSANHFFKI